MEKTTILSADSYFGGECVIEFDENGYTIMCDSRKVNDGYLHICEVSAEEITPACRDQIIMYLFNHPDKLPGIGATPQHKYFDGLSTEDVERIGNEGKKAYYNR